MEESDEPRWMGQLAGVIAMMSALVKALPRQTRDRLQRQIHTEFESLLSAMSATSGPDVHVDRSSVEWMRDLFLKRIDQLNSQRPARPVSRRKATSAHKPVAE